MHNFGSGADFEVLDLAGVAQEKDVVLVPKKMSPFKKYRGIKKKMFSGPGIWTFKEMQKLRFSWQSLF